MEEFKSPTSRLLQMFKDGRDNWREKALEKQKKLRASEIKIRDLKASREYWKNRALAAEEEIIKQQKIEDKLGWVKDYKFELPRWRQMIEMTRTLEIQLKLNGLNKQSLSIFESNDFSCLDDGLKNFLLHIFEYLREFTSQVPDDKTLLATSDVIESLFGKYKKFSARSPLKQMGQILLTISLSTMNLTTEVVKCALETIRFVCRC